MAEEQKQDAEAQEVAETTEAAEPAAEEAVEQPNVEVLQAELEKERAAAKDYLDQLLRARADYANYKRRAEQERKELLRSANAELVAKLLPTLDDFERAFQTLPHNLGKMTWIEGVALIHRKLQFVLESEGLQPIEVKDGKLDPAVHEAISYEEREDMEDGDIIAEVQRGYRMGDRVLRPSLVRVARHVDKPAEAAEKTAEPVEAQQETVQEPKENIED